MPNVFIEIAFKSRFKEILEMRHRKNFSKKFLFLLSKGDRSESVNQFLIKCLCLPLIVCAKILESTLLQTKILTQQI